MKCSVQKQCGACRYIGTSYPETLHKKHTYVSRLYPGQNVDLVRGMEDPYHYRHKVYAAFRRTKDNHLKAGMYEEGTHRVISSTECLIQHETANAIIRDFTVIADRMRLSAFHEDTGFGVLRHLYIRVSHLDGSVLLVIVIGTKDLPGSKKLTSELLKLHPEIKTIIVNQNHRRTSMVLGEREKVIYGPGYIFDAIQDVKFRISSKSFFQVNPVQTEVLYRTALELADIQQTDEVMDLCCGIGTITLLAAKQAHHVTGIEVVPQAIRDAKENARMNDIRNVSFFCADIVSYLSRHEIMADVVIADPPRAGLGKQACHAIGKSKCMKLVYISCNPMTQAEDYAILKTYGFEIQRIIPVDLFCFTEHVETVVLMSRVKD